MESKAQIWVETVIYTLIALAIMGLLLALIKPTIEEKKDKAVIEQSKLILDDINKKIEDVRFYGTGNSKIEEIVIKKGELIIDGKNDSIRFEVDSNYLASELGENITIGKIIMSTLKKSKGYKVAFKLDYIGVLNITVAGKDSSKSFLPAVAPHKFTITNEGKKGELIEISFVSF